MTIALVLFGIAALGGLALAALRFANRPLPMPLALLHGLLAASGLAALALAVVNGAPGGARTALVVFLLAALGGFFLFALHLKKRALPIPVVLVHGLAAVAAFVVLALAAIH